LQDEESCDLPQIFPHGGRRRGALLQVAAGPVQLDRGSGSGSKASPLVVTSSMGSRKSSFVALKAESSGSARQAKRQLKRRRQHQHGPLDAEWFGSFSDDESTFDHDGVERWEDKK